MMLLRKLIVIIASIRIAQASGGIKYTIKDLEVLESENNYSEFIEHAFDVRPIDRSKHWHNMLDNMASRSIDIKIKLNEYSQKAFLEIENLNKNASLTTDEVFQFKRNSYAKNYFKECFLNTEKIICDKQLDLFWTNSNQDPEIAFEFIKLVEENKSKLNSWSFYHSIVFDQIAPLYCKKPSVQSAILKQIGLASFGDSNFTDNQINITKIVPEKCLKELYPTLIDALTSEQTNGFEKEQALNILSTFKQISTEDKDYFMVVYLFGGPVNGEWMNLSWKLVESLSENYSKRQKIFEKIKKINLLPDDIFSDPVNSRNKSIINLFAQNFPELTDYYAQNCLDFLNLTNNTHVTSSKRCKQFLDQAKLVKSTQKIDWVSDKLNLQYSALKK